MRWAAACSSRDIRNVLLISSLPVSPAPYGTRLGGSNSTVSVVPTIVAGLPLNDPVTAISASSSHNLALTRSGKVYAWGWNSAGALGTGNYAGSFAPVAMINLPSNDPVTTISAGDLQSLLLTRSGQVYMTGSPFGIDVNAPWTTLSPTRVTGFPAGDPVTSIAAGKSQNLALTKSGHVYAWGGNLDSELGVSDIVSSTVPLTVTGLPLHDPAIAIAAGDGFSLALTRSGHVYSWGNNGRGELGTRTTTYVNGIAQSSTPVAVSGLSMGDPVVSIATGQDHSLALTKSGHIYSWGANGSGQIGTVNTTGSAAAVAVGGLSPNDQALSIAAGGDSSLALIKNRRVYAWGANIASQPGTSGLTTTTFPTSIKGLPIDDPIKALAAGGDYSMALTRSGVIYAWGYMSIGPPSIEFSPGTVANGQSFSEEG